MELKLEATIVVRLDDKQMDSIMEAILQKAVKEAENEA